VMMIIGSILLVTGVINLVLGVWNLRRTLQLRRQSEAVVYQTAWLKRIVLRLRPVVTTEKTPDETEFERGYRSCAEQVMYELVRMNNTNHKENQ
jgi:hypothetical protein